jgi:hypothetical protein
MRTKAGLLAEGKRDFNAVSGKLDCRLASLRRSREISTNEGVPGDESPNEICVTDPDKLAHDVVVCRIVPHMRSCRSAHVGTTLPGGPAGPHISLQLQYGEPVTSPWGGLTVSGIQVAGAVAVVTGGPSGIGRALAQRFAQRFGLIDVHRSNAGIGDPTWLGTNEQRERAFKVHMLAHVYVARHLDGPARSWPRDDHRIGCRSPTTTTWCWGVAMPWNPKRWPSPSRSRSLAATS